MSGGANQTFINNPGQFLNNNLVRVGLQNDAHHWKPPGVYTVNMELHPTEKAGTANGEVPVYRVVPAVGSSFRVFGTSHRFSAYYLAYRQNTAQEMTLGNAANFFFTDTLNGCCMVVGGAGATPKVAHINRTMGGVDDAPIDQTAINSDIMNMYPPTSAPRIFGKNQYKDNAAVYVTIVGIRNTNTGIWNFFWQRYEWAPPAHGVQIGATGKYYEVRDFRTQL